jgi:hypothetical protein
MMIQPVTGFSARIVREAAEVVPESMMMVITELGGNPRAHPDRLRLDVLPGYRSTGSGFGMRLTWHPLTGEEPSVRTRVSWSDSALPQIAFLPSLPRRVARYRPAGSLSVARSEAVRGDAFPSQDLHGLHGYKEEHRLTRSLGAPPRNKQATLNREAATIVLSPCFVPAKTASSPTKGAEAASSLAYDEITQKFGLHRHCISRV